MAALNYDSELSGDELANDFNVFDLVNVEGEERQILNRQWNAIMGDSDDDEAEFEGFELEDAYVPRDFVLTKTNNEQDILEFSQRVGPSRVLDGSRTALDFFQIFYTNSVFSENNQIYQFECGKETSTRGQRCLD